MPLLTRRRYAVVLLGFALFALVVVVVAPVFGPVTINVFTTLKVWALGGGSDSDAIAVDILMTLRLPRVVMAFLAGAALALAGAVFQALLRNPLATPYTLGIASGGSLGAVVCLFLPAFALRAGSPALHAAAVALNKGFGPFSGVQVSSFLSALAMVFIIYRLGRGARRVSTTGLLLAGVTLGLICSAAILLVRYLSEPNILKKMDYWLMGGLSVDGWGDVGSVLPFLLVGVGILMAQARKYDQMVFGAELAAGRGVNVDRLQKISFFGGSLTTASVVAVAGPIGFVGLIVPHAARRLIGPDHRLLLPCVFLGGGAFLAICDTVARSVFTGVELPVGVITALLGGPFFLYLLVRGRKEF